jgi:alpha-N-arabinofuranosidase
MTQLDRCAEQGAARGTDGISFHYYTMPTGKWDVKGAARLQGKRMVLDHVGHAAHGRPHPEKRRRLDKHDPEKKSACSSMSGAPGTTSRRAPTPASCSSRNTLRDAVVAALNFNIFHATRTAYA